VTNRRLLTATLLAACLAAAGPAPSRAELTPGTPAPDFTGSHVWIGSKPLSLKRELKGKVVLVDFWEYTCINCIRTLPALKRIYARYHRYGFEIIGDHAPEFDFAYKPENVTLGVRRERIPWPVIVDSDFSIWHAYDSNSWPNKFLIGANGIIVMQHAGEGGYGELERRIQEELRKANPRIVFPASYTIPPDTDDFDPKRCGTMSEETYVGTARGSRWGGEIANREGFEPGRTVLYRSAARPVRRGFSAHGLWKNEPDDFLHARRTSGPSDYIGIRYQGREVYAVMNLRSGDSARVVVTRDGRPLPPDRRGVDVRVDGRGRTYIEVREGRMYYVIRGEDDAPHDLRLYALPPGVAINSFTFGNRCLTDFDHL
jgi:thiol-disulfide isomerase/thioredoxin